MKAAGIADICNTFARIFQKAAGLKKAYAVQMIHNRAAGCAAEKPAEMLFGNIKMGSDIIQTPDGAVILINIGDNFGNERRAFRPFIPVLRGRFQGIFPAGVPQKGKNLYECRISPVILIFMYQFTDLEQKPERLRKALPG